MQRHAPALVLPTKDQVLLLDGRPLSVGIFMGLRQEMKSSPLEVVVWTAEGALALQNEARSRGQEISPKTAFDVARYASEEFTLQAVQGELETYFGKGRPIPPAYRVKNQIDQLLTRAVIQENEALLRQFH
jgi:hypothetical protein